MTGHLRGDARKRVTDAHQIHPDAAVRALIERERRAAAVAALRSAAVSAVSDGDDCVPWDHDHDRATVSCWLTDRADRIERGDA